MPDLLNGPMLAIAATVLTLLTLANELGYRFGRASGRTQSETSRTVANTIKASVIGFVAFLLGFAFSIAAGRHDVRREVVLNEANAAGTLYLRGGMLPEPEKTRLRSILGEYISSKLELCELEPNASRAKELKAATNRQLQALWRVLESAKQNDLESVRVSQVVPAANDVIDLNTTRDWAFSSHTQEAVLGVLLVCVLVSAGLIGHSFGECGPRHAWLCLAFNLLFTLTLYIILDFDGPKHGLIQVSHTPLLECQASFQDSQ